MGPADIVLAGIAPLDRAGPGDLSFLASGRYLPYFQRTSAGAVLLTPEFRVGATGPATLIVVDDPRAAVSAVLRVMYPERKPVWGIDPSATVGRGVRWAGRISLGLRANLGAGAKLGNGCEIGAFAVIGESAVLGNECTIGEHAVIHAGVRLGDRVVVGAGSRVGSPGFGYLKEEEGRVRVTHVGGCILDDDVEIGANVTIDRGSLDDTVIGKGTKIDNLVQVGHNVRIGARCLVMAQVGLAGSSIVEDDVVLAGQAGLAGHLTVGTGARVAAQAGVIGDVPPGATVSGYPARSHREVLRQTAVLKRLASKAASLERMMENVRE